MCKYFAEHQEPRPENRGGRRHADVDADKRKAVREHIQTFRSRSSHCSRMHSPGRKYLQNELSVAKMHQLFKEQNHVQTSYALFFSVFVSNFNLDSGCPATDVWATCVQFRSQIRNESLFDEDKKILTAEFILHCRRQLQFYNLMNDVKDTTTVCFDMMENLVLPRTQIGQAHYSRQLTLSYLGLSPTVRMAPKESKMCIFTAGSSLRTAKSRT